MLLGASRRSFEHPADAGSSRQFREHPGDRRFRPAALSFDRPPSQALRPPSGATFSLARGSHNGPGTTQIRPKPIRSAPDQEPSTNVQDDQIHPRTDQPETGLAKDRAGQRLDPFKSRPAKHQTRQRTAQALDNSPRRRRTAGCRPLHHPPWRPDRRPLNPEKSRSPPGRRGQVRESKRLRSNNAQCKDKRSRSPLMAGRSD